MSHRDSTPVIITATERGTRTGLFQPMWLRFHERVTVAEPDECWPWSGAIGPNGYGYFRINGATQAAHRVAWVMGYGEDPGPLWVLHTCDNPPCCNPRHLFLGTAQDNVDDMYAKGRQRLMPPRGDEHGNARLTTSEVLAIRAAVGNGGSVREMARVYGIAQCTVRSIVARRSWKHV